jgi:hypothetical protein
MIQDLIVSLQFAKAEFWHQQASVAHALRIHLYNSSEDPYGFCPEQFKSNFAEVVATLNNHSL